MPIYEYKCEKCKEVVEVLQKISDDPLTECEKCGGKIEKLFNQMNFHLSVSYTHLTLPTKA